MNVQEHLPLTETTFFIILSLAPGPKHGYAIMKEVEALSGDRVRLSTGTLYGALKRMLEGGWIDRLEKPELGDDSRGRKAYRLTKLGRRILEAEMARLRRLVSLAELQTEGKKT